MSISYRHQAEAVKVTALEWAAGIYRYESLPIGKGGIDPASLELKRMRLEALQAATRTLFSVADKDDEQREAAE